MGGSEFAWVAAQLHINPTGRFYANVENFLDFVRKHYLEKLMAFIRILALLSHRTLNQSGMSVSKQLTTSSNCMGTSEMGRSFSAKYSTELCWDLWKVKYIWLGVLVQYYQWVLNTTYWYSKSRMLNNCLHWAFLCRASLSFKLKLIARKWAQQSPIIIQIMATCWVSNSWGKFLVCMSKVWICKVSFSTNIDYPNLCCRWASSYEPGCLSNSLHHVGLTWVALVWLLQDLFFLLVLLDGPWLHFTHPITVLVFLEAPKGQKWKTSP